MKPTLPIPVNRHLPSPATNAQPSNALRQSGSAVHHDAIASLLIKLVHIDKTIAKTLDAKSIRNLSYFDEADIENRLQKVGRHANGAVAAIEHWLAIPASEASAQLPGVASAILRAGAESKRAFRELCALDAGGRDHPLGRNVALLATTHNSLATYLQGVIEGRPNLTPPNLNIGELFKDDGQQIPARSNRRFRAIVAASIGIALVGAVYLLRR